MISEIEFSISFEKAYLKLDGKTQSRVTHALKKLKEDFNSCDIKKLKTMDVWRLRVGD
ncbi:MAG: hypothetical protein WCJ01_00210 [Ignavibacteria bacterium]